MTVLKDFRYIVIDNALSQTFSNGRFTNARFTDENRVILVTAGQNLDYPIDFIVSADDRINFSLFCFFVEVHCKAVQIAQIHRFIRFAAVFRQYFLKGFLQFILGNAETFQNADSQAAAFMKNSQEQVFRTYVGISQFVGFFYCHFQHSLGPGCCIDFTGAEKRPALAVLGEQLLHCIHSDAQGIQNLATGAVFFMGNAQKKMFRADIVAAQFSSFGSGKFPGVFYAISKSIFHNNSSFFLEFSTFTTI